VVVVVVGEVVEVVGGGVVVGGVGDTTEVGVLVVGGELVEVVGRELDVGGGLMTMVDERTGVRIHVVGVVVEVCAGLGSVDGEMSPVTGVGIVDGGVGAGALVVGGDAT
jgi:hypothetical protein